MRSIAPALTGIVALLLVGSLSGSDARVHGTESTIAIPSSSATRSVGGDFVTDAADALIQLEGIPAKGRAPKTGYARDQFGPAWAHTDHNGCDTRNDILASVEFGRLFLQPGGDGIAGKVESFG